MEDENLEDNFVDCLLSVSKNSHFSKCVCTNSEEGTIKRGKKFNAIHGWKPPSKPANNRTFRGTNKKINNTIHHSVNNKNKRTEQQKHSEQKTYFCNYKSRPEHIEKYRKEFSTVKLLAKTNTDNDKWLDPYMPEKGNKGQLLMRIKLLETLSEICTRDFPGRDLRRKWNGLPPIRLANQQPLNISYSRDQTEVHISTQHEDRPDLGRHFYSDQKLKENDTQLSEEHNSKRNQTLVGGTSRQGFRCSTAQNEDFTNIEASCRQDNFHETDQIRYPEQQLAISKTYQDGHRLEKLISSWPDCRNTINVNNCKIKQDLTFCRSKTDFVKKRASLSVPYNSRLVSPKANRRNSGKQDSSAMLKEKSVDSIPSKKKANPLYISILGKSPICRESYDDGN